MNSDDNTKSYAVLTKGTEIKQYSIVKKIGAGGMGEVYLADDTKLDRQVALKFLPSRMTENISLRLRFTREAQSAAKLDHPNIVAIHEVAEFQGRPFFAMSHVEGSTLSEYAKLKSPAVSEIVDIVVQIAEGLSAAHEKGIVHRDIKPSNILIDSHGRARIVDFGLAYLKGKDDITKTGSTMGTIGYMSPEQVQGEKSDERSDLFSLGVVIYEMLSGKRPFEGENQAAILNGIINNSPPFLADINDKIPVKLIDIVEKLLDKDKNQRFQNARELIDALNDISGRNEIVQSIKDGTPSIAVLPFVNLSADPEQEYFCDGIAEEIINAITKVEKLKVVARTSAFAFKGKKADIRKIGKELNVGAILEGSVRKAGERIRITAQLIKVKDGFHLWSDRYDRTIKDVFAIQDEISLAIVEQLKVKLLGDEIQKVLVKRPENPEAHNLYLRGRHFWRMRSRRDLEKSIECFKSALEIEPEYARAYQGLAESYAVISSLDDNINANLAVENANKALSIDPTMGECHTTLAFDAMINFEFNHANELFDKAIEMTPRYSVAYHWASLCNCVLGNFDKMITQIDKAFDLDPLSVGLMGWRGLAQVYIGRPGKAVEFMEKNADFLKEIPMVSRSVCIAYLANNQLDEAEECLSSFDEFVEAHSKDSLAREAKSLKGLILAKRGQRKEARIILDELVKEIDKDSKVLMNCVKLGCELDMIDETLEWIKKAFEEKQFWMAMVVRYPDFDKLRKDSRYIDIMKNAGLKP